ncbi:hypothetical protein pb186bvf_015584 [Paramecium bursaria]
MNHTKVAEQWIQECLELDGQYKDLNHAGIGRKIFEAYGVSKENTDRIYKGLYVYSKGFNELLNQSLPSDIVIRSAVWKIYIILIERFNYSDYQLLIKGIIEHSHQEVQKLCQDHVEVSKDNENAQKVYDELKELYNQTVIESKKIIENLQSQIDTLNKKYLIADGAAEQELEKRYRLENKTGMIQDQYKEVCTKHQILLADFIDLRERYYYQQSELQELRNKQTSHAVQVEKLNTIISEQQSKIHEWKSQIESRDDQLSKNEIQIRVQQQEIIKQQQQLLNEQAVNRMQQINKPDLKDLIDKIAYKDVEINQLKQRLNQYSQQIESYLNERQLNLNQHIIDLEQKLQEQYNINQLLKQQFDKLKQKKQKIKNEYRVLKINQEIMLQNIQLKSSHLSDLESAQQFQIQSNSQLQQYIEKLTAALIKQEKNEELYQQRLKQQHETIEILSNQLDKVGRSYQGQIDPLQQSLLCKTIEFEELQSNLRDLRAQAQRSDELHNKELVQQFEQITELKEKLIKKTENVTFLEIQNQNLRNQMEQQKIEFNNFEEKRDDYQRQINHLQAQSVKNQKELSKAQHDNQFLENQNQTYQEKLKKQQAIIRDQQKEMEGVKQEYQKQLIMFEDSKMEYDYQIGFQQQTIKDMQIKKKQLEEDLIQNQNLVKKQIQTIIDQNDQIKRQDINVINLTQEMQILELKLSVSEDKQKVQERLKEEKVSDPKMTQQVQELITKKIIDKLNKKRQTRQLNTAQSDTLLSQQDEEIDFSQFLGQQLSNNLTLESILNNITDKLDYTTIQSDSISYQPGFSSQKKEDGVPKQLPYLQKKQEIQMSRSEHKPNISRSFKQQKSIVKTESSIEPLVKINQQKQKDSRNSFTSQQSLKIEEPQSQNAQKLRAVSKTRGFAGLQYLFLYFFNTQSDDILRNWELVLKNMYYLLKKQNLEKQNKQKILNFIYKIFNK